MGSLGPKVRFQRHQWPHPESFDVSYDHQQEDKSFSNFISYLSKKFTRTFLDFIYSVDKFKPANFKSILDVPLKDYDAAFICLPDDEKFKVVKYCIENKKHILIEKPIYFKDLKSFSKLQKLARQNKVVCYTAYNHRFEPHFIKMKKLINSKKLGKLYSCRIFYGNGTAKLVKKNWRDKGKGVRTDLLPHLLDVCRFWFGERVKEVESHIGEKEKSVYKS